jgi:DNA-binding HxlR family transcriptional regulator
MEKLPVWCHDEEWCPITATAKLIGKKWHPVILSRLLKESKGFNQLKRDTGGISAKVLSESLKDLQENGLVEKKQISESPKEVRYSLTERGQSLETVIMEMKDWGNSNLKAPEVSPT